MYKPAIWNIDNLLREYELTVCRNVDVIDPKKEHDWNYLVYGWALAKGLDPEKAEVFSRYVNYVLYNYASDDVINYKVRLKNAEFFTVNEHGKPSIVEEFNSLTEARDACDQFTNIKDSAGLDYDESEFEIIEFKDGIESRAITYSELLVAIELVDRNPKYLMRWDPSLATKNTIPPWSKQT